MVRQLYEDSADSCALMMDSEIELPVYDDTLTRLAERIAAVPGPIVDTSCGSGHMLSRYHERYEPARPLVGVDLSPRMIAIARARLETGAELVTGDMCQLMSIESGAAAAVLSFFAIHHLDRMGVATALGEWHRVLRPGGQLLVAAWEGEGPIDYGGESDVVALRYGRDNLVCWAQETGFAVDRRVVDPVEEMPMDAIYLEGTRA